MAAFALELDGATTARITGGYTNTIKNLNEHWIDLWIYRHRPIEGLEYLFTNYLGSPNIYNVILYYTGAQQQIWWTCGAGATNRFIYNCAFSGSTWYHLAFVKTGVATGKAYLNGVEQTETTGNVLLSTPNANGNLYVGGNSTSNLFDGYLDEIRIGSGLKSAAEVLSMYNGPGGGMGLYGTAVDPSNTILGYHCDDNTIPNTCEPYVGTTNLIRASGGSFLWVPGERSLESSGVNINNSVRRRMMMGGLNVS